MADLEQTFRVALVTILDANAAVKAATGRASGVQVVEFGQWGYSDPPLPILVYDLVTYDKATGRITLALTGVSGTSAANAREVLKAGSAALTYTAFAAQSLDVARWEGARSSVLLSGEDRLLARAGDEELHQADETLELMLLNAPD